jgi:hypothetical protein
MFTSTRFFYLARPFIHPATVPITGPRALFDIESNGLLDKASKAHCIVISDLDSDRVEEFGPEQIEKGLTRLSAATYLAGHNICTFDLPLLWKLYGWKPADGCTIVDTVVASRLILSHILDLDIKASKMGDPSLGKLMGGHSLEACGVRFGAPKTGTDITDWSIHGLVHMDAGNSGALRQRCGAEQAALEIPPAGRSPKRSSQFGAASRRGLRRDRGRGYAVRCEGW